MNITISSPGSPGTSYTDDVKKMIGDAWNWHKNHPNGFNN